MVKVNIFKNVVDKELQLDDGKNLMMTDYPKTIEERKKQERIWREVINQMQDEINNHSPIR